MVPEPVAVSGAQLDSVASSLRQLATHSNGWDWHTAIPTAIGAALALGAGLFQEHRKTRRERNKEKRQGREKELAQVAATITTLMFNLESVIHTAMQQVLPHFTASRAGLNVFLSSVQQPVHPSAVHIGIQQFIPHIFRRAPEPHFIETEAFRSLSFLLDKHSELVKQCGWIETFMRDLRFILRERNKLIDAVTIGAPKDGHGLGEIQFQIQTQVSVSHVELANSYQLIKTIISTVDALISAHKAEYRDVMGPKLTVRYPEVLSQVQADLHKSLQTEGLWEEMAAVYAP